jgi:predicted metal-dependent phosphotriesterase family hydrolase
MAKAVTVLGEVNPDSLGVVLPHEHLLWDQKCWGHPVPQELGDREEYSKPVSLANRGKVIYHAFDYYDKDMLRQLWQRHQQKSSDYSRLFWSILMFNLWFKKWIV